MKTSIAELVAKKELPSWMLKNRTFKEAKTVQKIFPSIGLANDSEEVQLDVSAVGMESAKLLCIDMIAYLQNAHYGLSAKIPLVNMKKRDSICVLMNSISSLRAALYDKERTACVVEGGKVKLKLPKDCGSYRKGESLIRIYNKIRAEVVALRFKITMPKLETMPSFKRFSSDNVPNAKYKVVLSSDGINGLWDIATMSMRGISSCQKWNGQYKYKLIGSILDKTTGVIYLTSGSKFNNLGTKMMKRCIVRYVVNAKTKEPFILIDKMYPEYDDNVYKLFEAFITKRVGDKMKVVFGPKMSSNDRDVSYTPANEGIPKKLVSYRDTKIPETKGAVRNLPGIISRSAQNVNTKRGNLYTAISQAIHLHHRNKGHALPVDQDYSGFIADLYVDMARDAFKSFEFNEHSFVGDSNDHMKMVYHRLLAMTMDKVVMKRYLMSLAKKLNAYYGQSDQKRSYKVLADTLAPFTTAVRTVVKAKLRESLMKLKGKQPKGLTFAQTSL